jgi:hypothetical protein
MEGGGLRKRGRWIGKAREVGWESEGVVFGKRGWWIGKAKGKVGWRKEVSGLEK